MGNLHASNRLQLLACWRNRQAKWPECHAHKGISIYKEAGERLRAEIRLEGIRIQANTVKIN
ncbi:MAG: hypothetical protein J4F97_03930 [Pseudomonadales bacterium]|nr:hypothetical protein [Pseudomonadales bacterium]